MAANDRNAWLQGGNACCNITPVGVAHPHHLILLGAPGVGKGTQAEMLSKHLGACHLSTGDIFRAARNTPAGQPGPAMKHALEAMRCGGLASDETVLALVAERSGCLRCCGGFLLDGFPRTVAQAEALEKVLAGRNVRLDAVLSYELSLKKVVARLSGRRTCFKCKAVFHIQWHPPVIEGICDYCGSTLYQREDDQPQAILVRIAAYQHSTGPLAEFYRSKGLLLSITAEGSPEEIFSESLQALQRARKQTTLP